LELSPQPPGPRAVAVDDSPVRLTRRLLHELAKLCLSQDDDGNRSAAAGLSNLLKIACDRIGAAWVVDDNQTIFGLGR
jgi:hypothetical protein